MPSESQIRQKFKEICRHNKWDYWFPIRTRWHREDIFNIGDVLISTKQGLKLIQLTTYSNISARRRKIKKILKKINLSCPIEIWGWNSKNKIFKIEIIK